MDRVIPVNHPGGAVGFWGKRDTHRRGEPHQAFSIFVFDRRSKWLIQQRRDSNNHISGLWANACRNHPGPGESLEEAAHRQLREEMGFDCELKEIFTFYYQTRLDKDRIDIEIDHVFIGEFNGEPRPDPEAVEDFAWARLDDIVLHMTCRPDEFSHGFRVAFNRVAVWNNGFLRLFPSS